VTSRSLQTAWALGVAALLGAAGGCSQARPPSPNEPTPGLVFPAHFAEGEAQDAGAAKPEPVPVEPAKRTSSPPDPEPLRQSEQYEYTIAYDAGVTYVVSVRAVKFPQPVVTARKMGRFAFELWIGTELVDRVRFDFPLLAAEEPPKHPRPLNEPPSLAGGVLKATVLVPAAVRARRAVLVDRGTDRETELPWPPAFGSAPDGGAPPLPAAPRDGGAPPDAGR
jgi:hypothetical protein